MTELQQAEKELYELTKRVAQLRKDAAPVEVKNYEFSTWTGLATLKQLFGDKDKLFVIHNMGQGCRYCTLWADGFNGFVGHLESEYAFVVVSKDSPQLQQKIARDRGWTFKMASHGGGDSIQEQSANEGQGNAPGVVCYRKEGDTIYRLNSAPFGPGDEFCSLWNLLSLAGESEETFTPQFHYWKRPSQMDDGGRNLND